jgi:type I restriction enzyme M protein
MAFVQHMIASLNDTGRMAVVLPNGALFRGAGEQAVRKELIDEDIVEAVIQLPKDMFYGAGIPACYLIVNKAKPSARADRVQFVDASQCFERRDSKNVLADDDIERIVGAVRDDDDQEGFSVWVARDDIAAQRYSLLVRRYIRTGSTVDVMPVADAIAALDRARTERAKADAELERLLEHLRADVSSDEVPVG